MKLHLACLLLASLVAVALAVPGDVDDAPKLVRSRRNAFYSIIGSTLAFVHKVLTIAIDVIEAPLKVFINLKTGLGYWFSTGIWRS